MLTPVVITILVIIAAVILFVTELVSIDLVAMMIIVVLTLTNVITLDQSVAGFSNKATVTVMFMFVLSAALLKTGALQYAAHTLTGLFRRNFITGMAVLFATIGLFSAFINNTPVVAVFIPIVIQIARSIGVSSSKMLIPVSYAAIFGGTCTLIGTSTNIVVSGIAEKAGLPPIGMFDITPMGIIMLVVGIVYMLFIGMRLLPDRGNNQDLNTKFGLRGYITDVEIMEDSELIGKKLVESSLVHLLKMDVLEVRRGDSTFAIPPGDFILEANDRLKVRCDAEKLKSLKDRAKLDVKPNMRIGKDDLKGKNSNIVELMIASNSEVEGRTLQELDFKTRYRAMVLAIKHRDEVLHDDLHKVRLKAGDVLLAEVKKHYLKELKSMANDAEAPFVVLTEEPMIDFHKKQFAVTIAIITCVIGLATFDVVDILTGSIAAMCIFVLSGILTLNEAYEAISWKVIFLLAGALTLGTAMTNTGLDRLIATGLIDNLGGYGPVVIVSGLYLLTSLLTEIMSNNACAALLSPIAIAIAQQLDISPMPFLVAILFGASASFMTPVGYQTNTMVYGAGNYKFADFLRIGTPLNILFWLLASVLIPMFYKF
jgi:di/tricarboxylate transporter